MYKPFILVRQWQARYHSVTKMLGGEGGFLSSIFQRANFCESFYPPFKKAPIGALSNGGGDEITFVRLKPPKVATAKFATLINLVVELTLS